MAQTITTTKTSQNTFQDLQTSFTPVDWLNTTDKNETTLHLGFAEQPTAWHSNPRPRLEPKKIAPHGSESVSTYIIPREGHGSKTFKHNLQRHPHIGVKQRKTTQMTQTKECNAAKQTGPLPNPIQRSSKGRAGRRGTKIERTDRQTNK